MARQFITRAVTVLAILAVWTWATSSWPWWIP